MTDQMPRRRFLQAVGALTLARSIPTGMLPELGAGEPTGVDLSAMLNDVALNAESSAAALEELGQTFRITAQLCGEFSREIEKKEIQRLTIVRHPDGRQTIEGDDVEWQAVDGMYDGVRVAVEYDGREELISKIECVPRHAQGGDVTISWDSEDGVIRLEDRVIA